MGARKRDLVLEEKLNQSNEQLMSGWMQLSSLVYRFEKIEWYKAEQKGKALFGTPKALEYIQFVRESYCKYLDGENFNIPTTFEENPDNGMGIQAKTIDLYPQPKKKKNKFKKNFERLLELAPEIETQFHSEYLQKHNLLKGESYVHGYKKIDFDILRKQGDKLVCILSEIKRTKKQKEKISLEMMLLIDFKKGRLEALSLEKGNIIEEVYTNPFDRELVNLESRKHQNNFLSDWLKKLLKQRHCIKWQDGQEMLKEREVSNAQRENELKEKEIQDQADALEKKQQEFQEMIEDISEHLDYDIREVQKIVDENLSYDENFKLVSDAILKERQIQHESRKQEQEQQYKQMIKSIAESLNCSEEIVKQVALKDLNFAENLERATTHLFHLKLSTSFEALGSENFQLLNKLMPDLQRRLAYRHSRGEFTTPQGSWDVYWARTTERGALQFVICKRGKTEDSKTAPALIALTYHNKKAWVVSTEKGFYGLQQFIENGDEKAKGYRLEANYEFYRLLKSFEGKDCSFQWLNSPVDSHVTPSEPGDVSLTKAHKLEGIDQEQINWVNQYKMSMRIDSDEKALEDKSSLTLGQIIWKYTDRPPVKLEANGQITPYDFNKDHKKEPVKQ